MTSQYLQIDGNTLVTCKEDADAFISATALNLTSSTKKKVVVIADDTDIFVMLNYRRQKEMMDIIFYQHRLQKGWSVESMSPQFVDVKEHLLFIHAMTGCDTTSVPFGKGKKSFLNLLLKSKYLQERSAIMSDIWEEKQEIGDTSMKAFIMMYGGNKEDTLASLW